MPGWQRNPAILLIRNWQYCCNILILMIGLRDSSWFLISRSYICTYCIRSSYNLPSNTLKTGRFPAPLRLALASRWCDWSFRARTVLEVGKKIFIMKSFEFLIETKKVVKISYDCSVYSVSIEGPDQSFQISRQVLHWLEFSENHQIIFLKNSLLFVSNKIFP